MTNRRIKADEMLAIGRENWPTGYDNIHEFAIYLNRVNQLTFLQVEKIMRNNALSPTEFDVLATLRKSAPPYILSPTELQNSMLITSGGLTKLLYQLEDRQLISRSVQEHDKRSKLVHLSSKGNKTVERAMKAVLKYEDNWISETLSEAELTKLNKLLGKLNTSLENRLFK